MNFNLTLKATWLTFLCFMLIACDSSLSEKQAQSTATNSQQPKIVIIGHFYPLLSPIYLQILKDQVASIENLGAIVFAGDMVPNSTFNQFDLLHKDFASFFEVPLYYIPANHEMSNEKLFLNKASQFSKVGNHTFYLDKKKFILFSAHKANQKSSKANIDCADTSLLKDAILDKSQEFNQSFLVLADMRCHKKKQWQTNIQPLIDEHIDVVIIGDNESTKYTYTWEEYRGVAYIYQGITHRGHGLSGENTFLIVDGDSIKVKHLSISNALDAAYKTNNKFKKLK